MACLLLLSSVMSAIGGIYSRNRRSIEQKFLLGQLSRAMRDIAPDGESYKATDPVWMLHRPFHVDSESRFSRQPFLARDGLMLAWDGRLDNAPELRRALGGKASSVPTVDLVLGAYRKWGIWGFAQLCGDFALALWDPRAGRLYLARDPLGIRPIYFHATSHFLFWSSRASALDEVLGLSRPPAAADGPFAGVHTIPGGHVLIAGRGRTELCRYWSGEPSHRIRYRESAEYEAHFRQLFQRAVADRLRAEGPVSVAVGDPGSAAIAAMGERLLAQGVAAAAALHRLNGEDPAERMGRAGSKVLLNAWGYDLLKAAGHGRRTRSPWRFWDRFLGRCARPELPPEGPPGVERLAVLYPYLDRRLFEFTAAIPARELRPTTGLTFVERALAEVFEDGAEPRPPAIHRPAWEGRRSA